jgi:hypothetical protein
MNTWSSQYVVDQLTSQLAERRQQVRDRRSAYLALARAIVSDSAADQLYAVELSQPTPLGQRHGHAA